MDAPPEESILEGPTPDRSGPGRPLHEGVRDLFAIMFVATDAAMPEAKPTGDDGVRLAEEIVASGG